MHEMKGERKKYRVQASTTTNTYFYCLVAARNALQRAKQQQSGSFYFSMMAGVFAAFTVEAFLNHLGQRKVNDWEAFERKLGPREKLLLLKQALHLPVNPATRPFQTLNDMLRLRDALAHGKTVTMMSDMIVENPHDKGAQYPEPNWKKLCSLTSIVRMVEDAEAMVRQLNSQAGSKRDPFGSLGYGTVGVTESGDE